MKQINVISVCGSGTVTSSMVAGKVKEFLEDNGYRAKTIEVNPGGVEGALASGSWDIIVHTSPLQTKYDVPTINSVGLLTGMGEEDFFDELLTEVKNIV